ncbi:SecY-interacting protein [Pantoea sp. B550]|uniref:SecY-interacting protein n=1 Tax=unclassified Pantoea TaxID=2630326 RepID=UPI000E907685|nr:MULTISPECIES: SecY-interacting protein [Pantoea]HBV90651.1 SecY-interacting protein [Pantoea sp.]MCP1205567.1 SecY-interacting protein [Pantoea sp. B550]MCT2420050.1 SecY-interacting protein [Pantoea sp. XY16]NBB54373.1 SecY-interacting protein [Pantoea vagans]WIL42798.1 SecY-interacting protein [Pantoea agglomerans]
MMQQTAAALRDFTTRYCQHWLQQTGHAPASSDLYGVPSPCALEDRDQRVIWQPQPFSLPPTLDAVERAVDIQLQPPMTDFYTTQFAGDMQARFGENQLTLLQVWSEEDFLRLQENLIGHLVMQRRLKQSPTLFIATTDSEEEIISLSNLSGEVILEQPGRKQRVVLAENLEIFLKSLQPVII